MKVSTTRSVIMIMLVAGISMLTYSRATDGYNTQRGAAIGAIGGAIVGQAIGHNTKGTIAGAAGGALVGAMAGNAEDHLSSQDMANAPTPRLTIVLLR
jgi:uncharacterized protein YcfJ